MQQENGDDNKQLGSPHPQQQQPSEESGREQSSFHASSRRGLLGSFKSRDSEERRAHVAKLALLIPQNISFSTLSASGTLRWRRILSFPIQSLYMLMDTRERLSLETPSSTSGHHSFREGLNLPLIGEVRWEDLAKSCKLWVRNPKNLALLIWGIAVGVSGAMLFLIMVGFLDHAIQSKSQRDAWFEANNQILNALFTLMCLYLHPQRLLHLCLLWRWKPNDIRKLRKVYCKDGTYKPHEWSRMMVVVVLLNLNCFAQYALCGLNWGYRRSDRPVVGVGLCLAVAMGAPAAAGIYTSLSSLGKDYVEDEEHLVEREENELAQERKLKEKPSFKIGKGWRNASKRSFMTREGNLVKEPQWRGGLLDIRSDPQVTLFTMFCGFCVFGWNMERLGFGNRFVHIATFILLCTAPYWIFFLAATNIDNTYVRKGLSYGGIILCIFGLLYGGFWRIQMRKTYGLPPNKCCCGKAALTDCFLWLFCSLCSLCQEVRTSEAYRIHNSKFYSRYKSPLTSNNATPQRHSNGEDFAATVLSPPPLEVFAEMEDGHLSEFSVMPGNHKGLPLMPLENGELNSAPCHDVESQSSADASMSAPCFEVIHDMESKQSSNITVITMEHEALHSISEEDRGTHAVENRETHPGFRQGGESQSLQVPSTMAEESGKLS